MESVRANGSRLEPVRPAGSPTYPTTTVDANEIERLLGNVACAVIGASTHELAPDVTWDSWAMPHHCLLIGTRGRGMATIGAQAYALDETTVLLVPPLAPHLVTGGAEGPLQFLYLQFAARLHGFLDMPALYGLPVCHRPTETSMAKIVEAARRIAHDLERARPGYVLAVNSQCLRILAFLWRETAESGASPLFSGSGRIADMARLSPALRVIEARYAEPLTLVDLARAVHLHPTYFAALFRQATGLPPHHYLARYRLERARDLLLGTDHGIDEIAAGTGHADRSHLSRAFQRWMGVSPSQYRLAQGLQHHR